MSRRGGVDLKRLKEAIDYNFYKTTKNYWSPTKIEIPYKLVINWKKIMLSIDKQKNGTPIRVKIGENLDKYEWKINIDTWELYFFSDSVDYYFTPSGEDHFFKVIKEYLGEWEKYFELIESELPDKSFVMPWEGEDEDDNNDYHGRLNDVFSWGKPSIGNLRLKWDSNDLNFDDLILDDDVRKEFRDMLWLIENKWLLKQYNVQPTKGYILLWRPWIWKTSIMKAITKESWDKVAIFNVSRRDYTSMWVWEWEKKIAKVLKWIQEYWEKKWVHCIIFFDEFETIWQLRKNTHEAHAAEFNELLRFLDGLWKSDNVTFIAATNAELGDLDPAIKRWWRTDKIIEMKMPNREQIWEYLKKRLGNNSLFKENILRMETYMLCEWLSFADMNSFINDLWREVILKRRDLWDKNFVIDNDIFTKKLKEFRKSRGLIPNPVPKEDLFIRPRSPENSKGDKTPKSDVVQLFPNSKKDN
jgi:hypothetical protein